MADASVSRQKRRRPPHVQRERERERVRAEGVGEGEGGEMCRFVIAIRARPLSLPRPLRKKVPTEKRRGSDQKKKQKREKKKVCNSESGNKIIASRIYHCGIARELPVARDANGSLGPPARRLG